MPQIDLNDTVLDKHADVLDNLIAHYKNVIDTITNHGSKAVSALNATGFHQRHAYAYQQWLHNSVISLNDEITRLTTVSSYFRTYAEAIRKAEKQLTLPLQ